MTPLFSDIANSGFLPTRGSFMLDFVFLAMFLITPIMGLAIAIARYQRRYDLHKWIQIVLAVVLAVAVAAFEIDLRFFTDWRTLAEPSPFYDSGWVDVSLWIHLAFAVPTPFLWIFVIVQALRFFPSPAAPSVHSQSHVFWGRTAAIAMTMTAVTGWIFYVLAFVL